MTPQVLDKLKSIASRYDELTQLISSPEVQADSTKYQKHAKELSELQETVDVFAEYRAASASLAETRDLASGGDSELALLAVDEISSLEGRLEALETRLRSLLTPRDPNDGRNVVIEIRAGTGGDEAALFAADLFRMYSRFAERQGWKVDLLGSSDSTGGGLKEVSATIEGKGVYRRLKHESGVHRVQVGSPGTELEFAL